MSILCTFGHDWWQYPAGSPSIASFPGPIGECRRCGAVDWVFDNSSDQPHDRIRPYEEETTGPGDPNG